MKIATLLLLLLPVLACGQNTRPNILLIVADDLGFTDIGSFGSEIPTPSLDALAYQGMRLANLHAGASCRPTRLMLMSGTTAHAANQPEADANRGGHLGLDYATIGELLQDAGYATYVAGKWDLGELPGYTPDARGFDQSSVILGGSGSYLGEPLGSEFELREGDRMLTRDDLPKNFYTTDFFTDRIIEYIDSTPGERPWFAYLAHNAPHWPLQLPAAWLDRNRGRYDMGYDAIRAERIDRATRLGILPENANDREYLPTAEPWTTLSEDTRNRYARAHEVFAAVVEYMDTAVGRLVDYLRETGQLENTVIVFTADHGASGTPYGIVGGDRPPAARNMPAGVDNRIENYGRATSFIDRGMAYAEAATAPYRESKGSLYKGGLLASGFVYYPAEVRSGTVSHAFVTMMDLLPTFLEIAGSEHPGAGMYRNERHIEAIEGRSAWQHLTGNTDTVHSGDTALVWLDELTGGSAVYRGNYKLLNMPRRLGPGAAEPGTWQLFDLANDPTELSDITEQYPELVEELLQEWERESHH